MSVNIPLAERMRPKTFDGYIGQKHLVGEKGVFTKFISSGIVPSFILWGPPGIGKTTLANIIARASGREFIILSAVNSGVKDVREAIEKAKAMSFFDSASPILFIDEIHRFSKSQQDSLLGAVEQGVVTLIGATTENPSFEVIRPLLSRCQVYTLNSLNKSELVELVDRTLKYDSILSKQNVVVEQYESLLKFSGGDARKLLNIIEIVCSYLQDNPIINNDLVEDIIKNNPTEYDKGGEMHYDVISAFIKSIRGSDPNAAIYYLAKMISGGEDAKFIARRLLISASEDVGLANPNAMLIAQAAFEAIERIGMPEGRIPLAQATIYLATSPKSNSAYMAIGKAMDFVKNDKEKRSVPLSLRNAPTSLMKELGYGDNYLYSHDGKGNFAYQDFMPEGLSNLSFYETGSNPKENGTSEYMKSLWGNKYKF